MTRRGASDLARSASRSRLRPEGRAPAHGPAACRRPTAWSRRPSSCPSGTNATVKALDPDDLREVGAQHHPLQHLPPLPATRTRAHRATSADSTAFMGWDRPILTDSGGFQVVSLGDLRKIDEDGVTLPLAPRRRAHRLHARARHRHPGGARLGHRGLPRPAGTAAMPRRGARSREATARTHRWAERCLDAHRRPDQALFGIIQGGLEPDLRTGSTEAIAALPFDGICIGGLAGDETRGAAPCRARRGRAAPGRRSASALPDGPGLAHGPARRGRCGRGHVRLGAAGARRPQRPRCGCPRVG